MFLEEEQEITDPETNKQTNITNKQTKLKILPNLFCGGSRYFPQHIHIHIWPQSSHYLAGWRNCVVATRLFSEMRMISVFGHSTVTKGRELLTREATSLFRSVPLTLTPAQSVVRSPFALHFHSQHCTHAGADSASTEITEGGFHDGGVNLWVLRLFHKELSVKPSIKLKLQQYFLSLICHCVSIVTVIFLYLLLWGICKSSVYDS